MKIVHIIYFSMSDLVNLHKQLKNIYTNLLCSIKPTINEITAYNIIIASNCASTASILSIILTYNFKCNVVFKIIGIIVVTLSVISSTYYLYNDTYIRWRDMTNDIRSIFKNNVFHNVYLEDEYRNVMNFYDEHKIRYTNKYKFITFCKLGAIATEIMTMIGAVGVIFGAPENVFSLLGLAMGAIGNMIVDYFFCDARKYFRFPQNEYAYYCTMSHLKKIIQYVKQQKQLKSHTCKCTNIESTPSAPYIEPDAVCQNKSNTYNSIYPNTI